MNRQGCLAEALCFVVAAACTSGSALAQGRCPAHASDNGRGACSCDQNWVVIDGACVAYCQGPHETWQSDDQGQVSCNCNEGYMYTDAAAADRDHSVMNNLCQVAGPDACQYSGDGECDEPQYCPVGTDTADCGGGGGPSAPSSQGCACASSSYINGEFSHQGCGTGIDLTQFGFQNNPWCTTDPQSCHGALGSGTDYCSPGDQADACQYSGDGECDEPQYCAAGTDTADCSGGAGPSVGVPVGCECALTTSMDGTFSHNGCGNGVDLSQFGYPSGNWCDTMDNTWCGCRDPCLPTVC